MPVNHTLARLEHLAPDLDLDLGGRIWLFERVLGPPATPLFHTLCNELSWEQPQVRVYGRLHSVPRLTCWLGDDGVSYRYSGLVHRADGWPACLDTLRQRLRDLSGRQANGALANLYRDGRDSMGWHRDNEPELGPHPWIVSYNLGVTRDFCLRPYGQQGQSHRLPLAHDSLLIMAPEVQQYYEHALPRRLRVQAPRLNLTFREISQKTSK